MALNDKRLVIVDDDTDLLDLLKAAFEADSYQVALFQDAPDALAYIRATGLPHLILIDLELPSMHGFDLSARLKSMGDVPIIFITGKNDTDLVVDGLRRYADDFIIKPVKVAELLARVKRVLSRISDFSYVQPPVIRVDDWLSVDFGRSRITVGTKQATLTPTEAALLHILMRNPGRVVTSETLIARVWPTTEVYEDTLRVHMHRLRAKVEPDIRHPKYIQTERGIGYRFLMANIPAQALTTSQS